MEQTTALDSLRCCAFEVRGVFVTKRIVIILGSKSPMFLAVPSPFSSGILLFKKWPKSGSIGGFQRERWVKRMGNQT